MTYRTNDTDNTFTATDSVSAPVRHLRRRRRLAALRHRSGGASLIGFGI